MVVVTIFVFAKSQTKMHPVKYYGTFLQKLRAESAVELLGDHYGL
jgi:hypothetical protein